MPTCFCCNVHDNWSFKGEKLMAMADAPYRCGVCKKEFPSGQYLEFQKHLASHSGGENE